MGLKKYPLVILSILLILLIFVSSASATDANETEMLTIDESTNPENNLLSINNIESNELDNNTLKVSNDEVLTAGNNNWYVNGSLTTDGNGTINNPFNNLYSAILKAKDNDVIYIASELLKALFELGRY